MTNDLDRAHSALQAISPNVPREDWVKVAMGAHAAGISFDSFDQWSSHGDTYTQAAARDLWKSIKPGKGRSAATLFDIAKQHGWRDGKTSPPRPAKATPVPKPAPKPLRPGMAPAEVWERAAPATAQHPYCAKKEISDGPALAGLRVLPDTDALRIGGHSMAGALLVPVCGPDGALLSLQAIPPTGPKMNLPGCPMAGVHVVGQLVAGQPAYVCEGIGAAWACWGETGHAAVVAFGVGNMGKAAGAVQTMCPGARPVLVPDSGKEAEADKVAQELGCAVAYMPEGKPSNYDAWDCWQDESQPGAVALAAILEAATGPTEAPERLPLGIVFADQLGDTYNPPDELVQGLLTVGDGSMLYGDSNSGKTFFAIDLACAVARGVEWHGRKVEQGLVMYVASESPGSVRGRLQAYQQHHRCKVPNFAIVQSPLDLFSDDVDTVALIDAAKHLERLAGQPVRLIVGDTLARLSAGANENSGQDMGLVVQRFDRIRRATGAHFLMIHHSGKAAAAGARGWSGIRAAVDTEIEVTDAPTGRCAEATKQRDLSTKGERIGFTLERVTLGLTKWGEQATSCVVVPTDAPDKPTGKRMGEVEGAVVEFLASRKVGVKKADVAKHFDGRYKGPNVYRAIRSLVAANAVWEVAGMVSIASPAT